MINSSGKINCLEESNGLLSIIINAIIHNYGGNLILFASLAGRSTIAAWSNNR